MADPVQAKGASLDERWIQVDDGVALRAMTWTPTRAPVHRPPLLFLPGWVSAVHGWAAVVRALCCDRTVIYVESREKGSARVERSGLRPHDFSLPRLALDVVRACRELSLGDGAFDAAGSSLGATSLLEAMKHDRLRPRRAFLVGPNTEFRFPTWFRPMLRLPAPSYAAIKHLVLWYLRHVKVDVRKEPEQMERYETTLKEAKPDRIKLSAMALSTYSVWPDLETVRVPCAVAWAHSDTLHDAHNIARMLRVLPAATEVRCPSNKHMHDAPVAADMRAFLDA